MSTVQGGIFLSWAGLFNALTIVSQVKGGRKTIIRLQKSSFVLKKKTEIDPKKLLCADL